MNKQIPMLNNNTKDYNNVIVNKLILGLGRTKDSKISVDFPKVKRSLFGARKKTHYLIPQKGVSILSSPAVIIRLSAMARARKVSYFAV